MRFVSHTGEEIQKNDIKQHFLLITDSGTEYNEQFEAGEVSSGSVVYVFDPSLQSLVEDPRAYQTLRENIKNLIDSKIRPELQNAKKLLEKTQNELKQTSDIENIILDMKSVRVHTKLSPNGTTTETQSNSLLELMETTKEHLQSVYDQSKKKETLLSDTIGSLEEEFNKIQKNFEEIVANSPQNIIIDVRNRLCLLLKELENPILMNDISCLNHNVDLLVCAKKLPQHYKSCLEEVVRRRHFHTQSENEFKYVNHIMKQIQQKEEMKRSSFLEIIRSNEHLNNILIKQLLPILKQLPPEIKLNKSSTEWYKKLKEEESRLPVLNPEDVEDTSFMVLNESMMPSTSEPQDVMTKNEKECTENDEILSSIGSESLSEVSEAELAVFDALNNRDQEIEKKDQEINQLKQTLSELKSFSSNSSTYKDEEVQRLKKELKDQSDKNIELSNQLMDFQQTNFDISQQLKMVTQEKESIAKENNDLQQIIVKLSTAGKNKAAKELTLQEEINQLKADHHNERSKMMEQIKQLEEILTSQELITSKLKKEQQNYMQKIEKMSADLLCEKKNNQILGTEIEQKKQQIKLLTEEIDTLKKNLSNKSKQFDEMLHSKSLDQKKLSDKFEEKNNALLKQLTERQEKLNDENRLLRKSLIDCKNHVTKLETEIKKKDEKLEIYENENVILLESVNSQKKNLQERDQQLRKISEQLAITMQSFKSSQKDAEKHLAENAKYSAKLETLERELSQCREIVKNLRHESQLKDDELNEMIQKYTESTKVKDMEIERLRSECKDKAINHANETIKGSTHAATGKSVILKKNEVKISLFNFNIDDMVFFRKQANSSNWEILNQNAPNYFLSPESLEMLKQRTKDKYELLSFVRAKILYIDTYTTSKQLNPYNLPVGTCFHMVHIYPFEDLK